MIFKVPLIILLSCLIYTGTFAGTSRHEPEVVSDSLENCKQCLLLAEQAGHRIAIADVPSGRIIWDWTASGSNIKPEDAKWFSNISEVKPVYGNKYLLITASGGGVALIRIQDKRAVFYAYAGGNTHSAELLPDGNIVAASSTGNYLTVFCTDSIGTGQGYSKRIPIEFGHNVVLDRKTKLLWSAAMSKLKGFRYNGDKVQPDLILEKQIELPGKDAHDLFPVYGAHALWFTNTTGVYKIDMDSWEIKPATFNQPNIKSVSSGPAGYPIVLVRPKQSWWTDTIVDLDDHVVFSLKGLKIYKARWLLKNTFSYR